ncbi:hypothetical protein RN001_003615 [Aquatica leii]|uniref:Uncharacterized protein n=1 Tax=Aquatica leii TaxID=1421715 RepID=A0AAN7Q6H7_9COLE|nr:hypothetical protein RN001_003615 [Aquatica leii]
MSDQPGPSKRIKFNDSNFEDTVMRWYNEIDEDASDVGSGDENIVSDHDSCSEEGLSISGEIDAEEQELEDCIEEKKNKNSTAVNKSPAKVFYGKNKFKWKSEPDTPRRKTPKHNIIMHLPGLRGPAMQSTTATSALIWSYFLDDDMLTTVVYFTNRKLSQMAVNYKNKSRNFPSRLPIPMSVNDHVDSDENVPTINSIFVDVPPVTQDEVAKATRTDPILDKETDFLATTIHANKEGLIRDTATPPRTIISDAAAVNSPRPKWSSSVAPASSLLSNNNCNPACSSVTLSSSSFADVLQIVSPAAVSDVTRRDKRERRKKEKSVILTSTTAKQALEETRSSNSSNVAAT